jgi:flavin reductase (DIM6/NTAB) family NADH-FMN oxidoreductase RutF
MKKHVDAFDYAGTVCKEMAKGILITTKLDGKVNTMTIGWGHIGIEWGKPIFIAYVRESRHTYTMLEGNGEFTVNIPMGQVDKKILGYCGTKSGRNTDKIRDMGLTLEDPSVISVPGIKELPLTLECKVIYKQKQDLSAIPAELLEKYYPQDVSDPDQGRNRDRHVAFYGEIVDSYIIE